MIGDRNEALKFAGRLALAVEKLALDKYITPITVTSMTLAVSSTFALQASSEDRAQARVEAQRELQKMSAAMVKEKGLLNHAQAALLLDVSTKRVGELVRLGKLTDFTFLGRKYVSMREIWARNKQDLKAGRPPRSTGKRMIAQVKAAAKTDAVQARLGGYAGPYHKLRERERKEKEIERRQQTREKRRADWKTIRERPKL